MRVPQTVFDRQYRTTTLGTLLGMSLVAFESLAITTIAPGFARALDGMSLYGWIFSSFLLMALLGILIAGPHIDCHGPRSSLIVGLALFAVAARGSGGEAEGFTLGLALALASAVAAYLTRRVERTGA